MQTRNCNSCTACCDGLLPGEVNGYEFKLDTPCFYNTGKSCSIYDSRPRMCKDYLCAWRSNNSIPEELDPRMSNMLLRVNRDGSIHAFVDRVDNPYIYNLEKLSVDKQVAIYVECGDTHVKSIGVESAKVFS